MLFIIFRFFSRSRQSSGSASKFAFFEAFPLEKIRIVVQLINLLQQSILQSVIHMCMKKCVNRSNIRHELLLFPLLDTLLVKLLSVLIAGAALLFLIQLLLNALPLLHQRRHFGLTLLGLQRDLRG